MGSVADTDARRARVCERIFGAGIRDGVIHGAAVVAGGPDGETFSGSWGWADPAHARPMTTRTVVDVASVTKAAAGVTAFLVAHARGLPPNFRRNCGAPRCSTPGGPGRRCAST